MEIRRQPEVISYFIPCRSLISVLLLIKPHLLPHQPDRSLLIKHLNLVMFMYGGNATLNLKFVNGNILKNACRVQTQISFLFFVAFAVVIC